MQCAVALPAASGAVTFIWRDPLVVCHDVGSLDRSPGDHVCSLLATEFSGMRRVSMIVRLAINILGVLGQTFSDMRR